MSQGKTHSPVWRRAVVGGVALAAISACSSPQEQATELAVPGAVSANVQTASGPVAPIERGAMNSYFAIPYAAPPVGDLRWKAPQPAASWTTPRAETVSGAACLQTSDTPFRIAGDSEDCLYLDVHTPDSEGPHPVMVWIHGGAFLTGSAGGYADPTPLVSKGAVVVAINYRMGAMGFLGHPTLAAADGSVGNYGMMDQQAALRWVKDNIAGFGGDPGNVTIFGESAGGFSVMTHLASPKSAGLFDKAIIQSGAYGVDGQLAQAELETQSATAVQKAVAAAGAGAGSACSGEAVTAACLRGLPEAAVREHLMTAFTAAVPNVVPSVDGNVLPQTIKQIFVAGANNDVPVINGSNENENLLFIAMAEMSARMAADPPNLDPSDKSFVMKPIAYTLGARSLAGQTTVRADEITKTYYPLTAFGDDVALQPSRAIAAAGTDSTFSCNGINVSKRIAEQGAPIWGYEFRDQTALPVVGTIDGKYPLSLPQGAAHAAELAYVFNMVDLGNAERKALQNSMSQYWVNFALTGNPNGAGVPEWKSFSTGSVQALDVESGGGVTQMPASDFISQHQCQSVWSKLTF